MDQALLVESSYDEENDIYTYRATVTDGPTLFFMENSPAYEYYTALINTIEGIH